MTQPDMTESPVLTEIRDELRELRQLYEDLVESLIPIETPSPEEYEAINSEDELVDEEELWKALR